MQNYTVSCTLQAIKFTLILETAVLPLSAYGGLLAAASPAAGAPPALLIPQRLAGTPCRQLLQLLAAGARPRGVEQAPAPAPSPLAAADTNAPAQVGTVCWGLAHFFMRAVSVACAGRLGGWPCRRLIMRYLHDLSPSTCCWGTSCNRRRAVWRVGKCNSNHNAAQGSLQALQACRRYAGCTDCVWLPKSQLFKVLAAM